MGPRKVASCAEPGTGLIKSRGHRGSNIVGSVVVTDTVWPLGLWWVEGWRSLAYFPFRSKVGEGLVS